MVIQYLVALGQKLQLGGGVGLEDLHLGGNVLLEVHGAGNTVLGQHVTGSSADGIKLGGGRGHPVIDGLEGGVEGHKGVAELLNLGDLILEPADNLQLLGHGLDLLVYDLLLVVGQGNGHAGEVIVDALEESVDARVSLVVDVLTLLEVLQGGGEVEALLDALDLLFGLLKVGGNGLVVLGVADPGILGLLEQLEAVLGLLLGVVPTDLDSLDNLISLDADHDD